MRMLGADVLAGLVALNVFLWQVNPGVCGKANLAAAVFIFLSFLAFITDRKMNE